MRLAPDGLRMALEVQRDGTGSEIRVLASKDGHFEAPFEDLAGICLPDGRSLRRPIFHTDGDRIPCIGEDEQRRWTPYLIDLRRSGLMRLAGNNNAATMIESFPFEASVDPDVDLVLSNEDEAAYFCCRVRAGRQRQIYRLDIPTGVSEAIGRTHVRIDALSILHFRNQLIYGADGAVWLSDGTTAHAVSHAVPGGEIRGLIPDEKGESLFYVVNGPDKAELYELSLDNLHPTLRADLGQVTVTKILGVMGSTNDEAIVGRTVLSAASILAAPGADYDETLAPDGPRALLAPELAGLAGRPGATPSGDASDVHGLTSVEETIAQSGHHHPVPVNQSEAGTGDTTTELSAQFDAHRSSPIVHPGVEGPQTALNETVSETVNHSLQIDGQSADASSKSTPSQVMKEQETGPDVSRTQWRRHRSYRPQNVPIQNDEDAQQAIHQSDDTYGHMRDESSDVWTTASPVQLPPQAKMEPVVKETPALRSPGADEEDKVRTVERKEIPRPDVDFIGFMEAVDSAPEPVHELACLKNYVGDVTVSYAANDYLNQCKASFASDPDRLTELIFAISAVALVRAKQSRPILLDMCREAYERIESRGALPEAEEHLRWLVFERSIPRGVDSPSWRSTMSMKQLFRKRRMPLSEKEKRLLSVSFVSLPTVIVMRWPNWLTRKATRRVNKKPLKMQL